MEENKNKTRDLNEAELEQVTGGKAGKCPSFVNQTETDPEEVLEVMEEVGSGFPHSAARKAAPPL